MAYRKYHASPFVSEAAIVDVRGYSTAGSACSTSDSMMLISLICNRAQKQLHMYK